MKNSNVSNSTPFTPISIDDANIHAKAEYGEYCSEYITYNTNGAMPLSFEEWQLSNFRESGMPAKEFKSGLI